MELLQFGKVDIEDILNNWQLFQVLHNYGANDLPNNWMRSSSCYEEYKVSEQKEVTLSRPSTSSDNGKSYHY